MREQDTVGARIGQARRELGVRLRKDITKAELARLVGVQPSSVGDWEENVSKPKGANLVRLAQELGVSAEWIIDGVETARAAEPSPAEYQAAKVKRAGTPGRYVERPSAAKKRPRDKSA